jgi:hypothetical protein
MVDRDKAARLLGELTGCLADLRRYRDRVSRHELNTVRAASTRKALRERRGGMRRPAAAPSVRLAPSNGPYGRNGESR